MNAKSKKIFRIVITFLVILAVLYSVVYGICQYLLSHNNVKKIIVTFVSDSLQRKVTASDDFNVKIGWDLIPHIVLKKVTVANAPWGKQGNMLTADEIDLVFDLLKLFSSNYELLGLRVVNAQLLLQTQGEKKNWDFGNTNGSKEISLNFEDIIINNAKITLLEDDYPPNIFSIETLQFKLDFHTDYLKFILHEFSSGKSDLHGNLLIKTDPLYVEGEFKAHVFSPRDFIGPSTGDGSYSIPHVDLYPEELRNSKINLKLDIDKIAIDKLPIFGFKSNVYIEDKVLHFDLEHPAKIANGTLDFSLAYDVNSENPSLKIIASTSELNFSDLLKSMFDSSPISGSTFNFNANLISSGSDLRVLVNSLSGKILAKAGPGSFLNTAATSANNIFTSVLSGLITFDPAVASTSFNCGVLNLKVTDGVARASNGIGIEAATVKVLGSGNVDLRNGSVNFTITPQTTVKGVLGGYSMAQDVTITGTIAEPKVSFNALEAIVPATTKIATSVGGAMGGGLAGAMVGSAIGDAVAGSNRGSHDVTASPCQTAMDSN